MRFNTEKCLLLKVDFRFIQKRRAAPLLILLGIWKKDRKKAHKKSSCPSLKSSFTSWSRECSNRGTGQGRLSDARDCVHWEPQPGSFDLDKQERRQVDPRQARLEQGRPGSSAAAALLSPLLLHRYNHAEGAPFGRRKRVWSPCVERCEHCYQNQLSWFHRSFSSRNTSLEESELEESEPVTPFFIMGIFKSFFLK